MLLQQIQEAIPAYAKDIKLNFSSILNSETPLTPQQHWGTLLASAIASKNKVLVNSIEEAAEKILTKEAIAAAKSAAALMAMTNIYYRFTHLVSNPEYTNMPVNLRMSAMGSPGIEKKDFELFSLAVSSINGCGKCIDAHEKVLITHGVSKDVIQNAVRIASITSALALVIQTETP